MLHNNPNFISLLQHKLLSGLPGFDIQKTMAPPIRGDKMIVPPTAKHGGVMIVLYPKNNVWHILLMKRTEDGGTHSGQISLPGGKKDDTDYTHTYTAIRELEEEMGINNITILGNLTGLYIPPSNFYILPIVAYTYEPLTIIPSQAEVKQVLEIPLDILFDPKYKATEEVYRSDEKHIVMHAPLYKLADDIRIWGATAMVLRELEELVRACS